MTTFKPFPATVSVLLLRPTQVFVYDVHEDTYSKLVASQQLERITDGAY